MSVELDGRDYGAPTRAGHSHAGTRTLAWCLQVAQFGLSGQRPLHTHRLVGFAAAALLRSICQDSGSRRVAHRCQTSGATARRLDPRQQSPRLSMRVAQTYGSRWNATPRGPPPRPSTAAVSRSPGWRAGRSSTPGARRSRRRRSRATRFTPSCESAHPVFLLVVNNNRLGGRVTTARMVITPWVT